MVFQSILSLIGSTLVSLGLASQLSRTLAFGSIGFGVQYALKPGVSYVSIQGKDGKKTTVAKQFALLSSKDSTAPTTYMPWYFWPLLFALFGAFFL